MITFHDISQNECEIKGGSLKNGYARAWYKGKTLLAHRVAWIKSCGEIPRGCQIHHLCGNRQCVKIEHLQLMTASEHQSLHYKEREYLHNDKKTHCKRGHELDGKTKHQRYCKTCHIASDRAYRLRKGLSCPAI